MIKQLFLALAQRLRPTSMGSQDCGFGPTITHQCKPADSLDELRERVWWTLSNCDQPSCARLATQITHAPDAMALWALRTDVFQCVAQSYGQAHAIKQIEQLQLSFAGWLPNKVLARSSEFAHSGFRVSRR